MTARDDVGNQQNIMGSDIESDDGKDGVFDGPAADAVRNVISDESSGRVFENVLYWRA